MCMYLESLCSHSGVEAFLIIEDICGLLVAIRVVSYMAEDDGRTVICFLCGSIVEENWHIM